MALLFFSGTVLRRWRNLSADAKCDIEIVVKANCVLVTNEQRSNVLVTQELVSDLNVFLSGENISLL